MPCSSFGVCSTDQESICPLHCVGCLEYKGNQSNITCIENRKRYNLQNNNYIVAKYHVDGGVIRSNRIKCDYLLLCYGERDNKAVFIELKGKNNRHAFDQLKESINSLNNVLSKLPNIRIYARLVNSKTAPNDLLSKNYKDLFELLQSLNNSEQKYIKHEKLNFDENIDDLE